MPDEVSEVRRRPHWTTTVPVVAALAVASAVGYSAAQQLSLREAIDRNGAAFNNFAVASEKRLRELEDYRVRHTAETERLIPFVESLKDGKRR